MADGIQSILFGISSDRFFEDDVIRSAVMYKLTVIGEAAAHVSLAIRQEYPDVPWKSVVGFRNLAIHEYFGTDWQYAWVTATEEVPVLREKIAGILAAEFGDEA